MYKYLPSIILIVICSNGLRSQVDCSKKLNVVKNQLETHKRIDGPILMEMSKSLDSCFSNDGISFYVKGLIELRRGAKSFNRSLNNFQSSASLGYTRAKTYIAYFYKNGWGVPIDYKKSLEWIELAANESDENAIYTLGYYYLKGLGGLEPNYDLAISYFERTDHRMAKYWLAFCKNFGLGESRDKAGADRLLSEVDIPESIEFQDFLKSFIGTDLESFKPSGSAVPYNLNTNGFESVLQGFWMEKDWKEEIVLRKIPLTVRLLSVETNRTNLQISLENRDYGITLDGYGKMTKNSIIKLSAPFVSPGHPKELTYELKGLDIFRDLESEAIAMECSTWILEHNEEGPPITIRVYGPEAINKKIDKSFYVFPNSFDQFLTYSFTLEFAAEVNLEIFDLTGTKVKQFDFKVLEPGTQTLEIDCNGLRPQNYVAVLSVNGNKFTRQVIKKY